MKFFIFLSICLSGLSRSETPGSLTRLTCSALIEVGRIVLRPWPRGPRLIEFPVLTRYAANTLTDHSRMMLVTAAILLLPNSSPTSSATSFGLLTGLSNYGGQSCDRCCCCRLSVMRMNNVGLVLPRMEAASRFAQAALLCLWLDWLTNWIFFFRLDSNIETHTYTLDDASTHVRGPRVGGLTAFDPWAWGRGFAPIVRCPLRRRIHWRKDGCRKSGWSWAQAAVRSMASATALASHKPVRNPSRFACNAYETYSNRPPYTTAGCGSCYLCDKKQSSWELFRCRWRCWQLV